MTLPCYAVVTLSQFSNFRQYMRFFIIGDFCGFGALTISTRRTLQEVKTGSRTTPQATLSHFSLICCVIFSTLRSLPKFAAMVLSDSISEFG